MLMTRYSLLRPYQRNSTFVLVPESYRILCQHARYHKERGESAYHYHNKQTLLPNPTNLPQVHIPSQTSFSFPSGPTYATFAPANLLSTGPRHPPNARYKLYQPPLPRYYREGEGWSCAGIVCQTIVRPVQFLWRNRGGILCIAVGAALAYGGFLAVLEAIKLIEQFLEWFRGVWGYLADLLTGVKDWLWEMWRWLGSTRQISRLA